MKKILILLICIVAVACSKEDAIVPAVNVTSPYILSRPTGNDSIELRRYAIYEKYGVPVFFNDTVAKRQIGTDAKGNPYYVSETLDLKWSFTNYENNVSYEITHYTTDDERSRALAFLEYYLENTPVKLRPFSIYLVDHFKQNNKDELYMDGFRTLVLAQTDSLEKQPPLPWDPDWNSFKTEVVNSMVLRRVQQNDNVVARFNYISGKNEWYDKFWKDEGNVKGLGCTSPVIGYAVWCEPTYFITRTSTFRRMYSSYYTRIFPDKTKPSSAVLNVEADAARELLMKEFAQFGFIHSDENNSKKTPSKGYDLKIYVETMLSMGSEGFKNSFGNYSLIMKKYDIIAEYLTKDIGLEF